MNQEDKITYTCKSGETFDSIALLLYGDEKYACELLGANPALCLKVVFTGGEVITVPNLELVKEEYDSASVSQIAPWRG